MRYRARVVVGKGRGKGMGFPTLNLEIPEAFDAKHGIYAGYVYIGEKKYTTAIHFGPVPTFREAEPTLEAYVLDTKLQEAPSELDIELVAFIREIRQFKGSDELREQIARDVAEVRKALALGRVERIL